MFRTSRTDGALTPSQGDEIRGLSALIELFFKKSGDLPGGGSLRVLEPGRGMVCRFWRWVWGGKCIKDSLPTCESYAFISGEILPPFKKEQAILKGRKNIF